MYIKEYLTKDHKDCDNEFATMENLINNNDFENGAKEFAKFANDLIHHFNMEEKIMFVTFETRSGMTGGPTDMMRHEHLQMRKLLDDLKEAVDAQNKDSFLATSDTLMFLMQQHNMKEEQMLYQMADSHLAGDAKLVVAEMQDLQREDLY
jgi:hemerythrin-like domain-containing protein